MTDFENIKAQCLERSQLWEDPDFQASQASVFYYQTPPFNFVWKRPKEIYHKPSFVWNNCSTFDVIPGKLGDKWLVSSLGVLFMCRGLFYRVVPADQRMDRDYAGIFRFRIWWFGQWREVMVDDRLPTVNGNLAFIQSTSSEQLWPALLEKAYAKLHGSYEALKYGSLVDGLADLTGGITETQPTPGPSEVERLRNLLGTSSIVTAHYFPGNNEDKQKSLVLEMNYRICEVQNTVTEEGTVYLVRLRRPHWEKELPNTVIIDVATWLSIPSRDRERFKSVDNSFWVLLKDLKLLFPHIEIVHLDAETSAAESSLTHKHKWQITSYQNSWKRGVSAGGCRNHANIFHINPQVQLVLDKADTVIVSLNQHSIMDPKVIGFSIYRTPEVLNEPAPAFLFRSIRSTVKSQYTNSRQVSYRCELQAGSYLIMPTTFEPRMEARFTLRVFSTKPITMMILDNPPQMLTPALLRAPSGDDEKRSFADYEMLFLQLADEHRTINTFDLQELLDMCLPNDYIKSCVSIETCRQIVLSLDKKGVGRISLLDFKDLMCSLQHWESIFKRHTREKIGVLRAERLRDTLRDTGFIVPEKVMALLVHRYMRKDGMLRFGDYVCAILHLQRTFELFYNNTNAMHPNHIQTNLTEWLHNSFSC